MIDARNGEARPATHTNASQPPNNNNMLFSKSPTNPATAHANQSIASHQQCATTPTVSDSVSEVNDSTGNAPMGIAWQAMYQHQQQSAFKTRPFPVPPCITIPPHPGQTLFSDLDVSMASRELAKMSPVFGSNSFTDAGLFVLSPQNCQLPSGVGSSGAAHQSSSPVKPSAALRFTSGEDDGGLPTSDARAAQPPTAKDLQFNARFISDTWAFDASPGNMYAMLMQPLDTSYQAMLAQQHHHQHVNSQIQYQLELQQLQQHPSLGIQTALSPLNARMHQVYPQMSPMATSPHQMQLAMPSHHADGAFSPTVNFSMVNFSELMMLNGGGGGNDNSGLSVQQSSPTSNILKHMLPPVAPQHGGVHVKDMTLNELRPHFNKPMAVVAKELGVCITLMKKICRRNGLVRWPHRRIRSLVNRITSLQVIAASATEAEKSRFEAQTAVLREELSAVIQNPNEKSRKAQADAKARSPSSSSMAVKDEELQEYCDRDDNEEIEQRVQSDELSLTPSGCEQEPYKTPPGSDATEAKLSSLEPVVCLKETDRDMLAPQKAGDAIREPSVCTPAEVSKKRKFGLLQQLNGGAGALLYPPPPIKIPCYRDGRPPRRNSAPEQQHLRVLGTFNSQERPSSTTSTRSNRRGSISSILCDAAE